MNESKTYLDPKVLSRIAGLELRARLVVEGTLSGRHRSPMHGFSVEFAEHRPYSPGDDLKHIDWKVWGRADRYFVKLYEEETNLRTYFLVDSSGSMRYRSAEMSKYDYGCTLAASLAYLLLMQQDAAALMLFDSALREELPPGSSAAHLRTMCELMQRSDPSDRSDDTRTGTNLGPVLHEVAERIGRRSLVILISDLLAPCPERLPAPAAEVIAGLNHLRYNRHEVIVWHVVDAAERTFPFDENVQFEGLESDERVRADSRQMREAYLREFNRFRTEIEDACGRLKADYCLADTSEPLDRTLSRFLASRMERR